MILGLEHWTLARPEIFLAVATALLLLYGVLRGEVATAFISVAASIALLATAVLLFMPYREGTAFANLFITDRLTTTMKALVLVGAAISILMSRAYFENVKSWRFEYPLLVSLATLGMMLMISANDLMSLYVGLELQSLALYVIAAFHRDSIRSTEAGVKYFVLGSVASGMLLFGASLIYGFCGGTSFVQISQALLAGKAGEIGTVIGLVFVVAGLAFKISAVPFHMWTPDVYEGAPTTGDGAVRRGAQDRGDLADGLGPDGAVQATVPAVAADHHCRRRPVDGVGRVRRPASAQHQAPDGLFLDRQRRLRAAGRGSRQREGCPVGRLLSRHLHGHDPGRVRRHPGDAPPRHHGRGRLGPGRPRQGSPDAALAMLIFMFSMAGIPPLAGFWGKLYIFMAAIEAKLFWPAILGVLASVVASYYYLRIVKVMYFDESTETLDSSSFGVNRAVALVAAVLLAVFSLAPQPLSLIAAAAAKGLFP
jgi:NADH-quinone oxidoreductase subunit N